MKKSLFYYSEKKLEYIEIKNFYSKFITLLLLFSTIFGLVFFGSYIFISNLLNPQSDIVNLRKENNILKEKYITLSSQISDLNEGIDLLNSKDKALRLSVNLDPISDEERNFGIGGSKFNGSGLSSVSDVNNLVDDVDFSLELLKSKFVVLKSNYEQIEKSLIDNIELQKSIPAIIPSKGPIGDRFGMRLHPILKIRRMHPGIDILVNTGTKIYAPGDGKVVKVGYMSGYGLTVEINHGFGYSSLYAHLSKAKVKKGQRVNRGDVIALSGKSGNLATGPHLHYEIKHNGVLLNPRNFIFSDMKVFDQLTEKSSNEEQNL